MAKISPSSIKYMIYAKFEAEGALEKPDVIGAIFGQTEGLLGSELEMRDLQKEGKIGRIEVELKAENSKTSGKIFVPSALDKTETTLIAAAIETIERVGPSNAKIEIEKIEDVRENKREFILERAKKLLESIEEKMPKTREIAKNLKAESRVKKLKEYGEEKLSSGNIEGNEIIIVEGRADVINLLSNGVENVIGMDGTKLPEAIKELSYNKETTLFLDGDRGGKLIAKNVLDNARIDYITFAPDGKEVEELNDKEILTCLRKKIPAGEFSRGKRERFEIRKEEQGRGETAENLSDNKEKLKKFLEEVENTKLAIILDSQLNLIKKVSIRALFSVLEKERAYALVIDTLTPYVVRIAEEFGVKNIAAKNFSLVKETRINLISL